MSRRIDIELTSALADGSYTWRAAGAREPKGVLVGSILPPGAAVGDELKVEIDQMIDGIEVLAVVKGREKPAPDRLELLPSDKPFEAVIETRAKRDRGGGGRRDDRGPRGRDGKGRGGRDRDGGRRDGGRDGKRDGSRDGARDGGRGGPDTKRREGGERAGRGGEGGRTRRDRPHFDPPPEVPQRPKPKRLRPGKAHRNEVLAALPEDQRPIAELALQGMAAVRTRLAEENAKLAAAGKPVMPESSVTKMAEELLPKLRVADWHDRAEAALRQIEHLDLRDLRSVVAASADSIVARDESTRALTEELRAALVRKQEEELRLWLEDVDAALGVGRAIRALRLSSQPPKAGVMFPPDLARRLAEAATKSLQPEDSAERWAAVMEAAAFSPVRALIAPTAPPTEMTDDLRKTALRLGPLLPQLATLLGVEVPPDAPKPKPLRPQHRKDGKDGKGRSTKAGSGGRGARGGGDRAGSGDGGGRRQRPEDQRRASKPAPAEPAPDTAPPDTAPADSAPTDTAPTDTAPADTALAESAPAESAPADTAPADTAPAESAPADTAPDASPGDTTPGDTAPADGAPTATEPAGTAPPGAPRATPPADRTGVSGGETAGDAS